MANRALNYNHLFVIVVLLVAGACGSPKQCDQRCKAMHSDGVGSCGFNSCTCVYKNNCKH
ncbi:hypothetical protein Lalb_Chr11g0074911 [Lupinus albus]|uniref:Knottin, scorpion toxin n=1 Tax=Lupinus albus TaxID=3870 RepID=A0A6A4PSW6_LUPAL|nr:hypothetical protein Lalb_Chr11g0074911 [Lupinus albus]